MYIVYTISRDRIRKISVVRSFLDFEEWLNCYDKYNARGHINQILALEVVMFEPTYSCHPPPVFIPILSVIQASFQD